ncbi:MAG: hypothetical protein WAQ26_00240 [Candidatus Saccharimonas aalborgensis]
MTQTSSSHFRWPGDIFGGKAIELAGRVVHPEYQGLGIATDLLTRLVANEKPLYLTTYTRNPAILRMMRHVTSSLAPLDDDHELMALAAAQPHASLRGNVTYHMNRYSEAGLFQGDDPADRPVTKGGVSLKEQFPALQSVRHALVVAARVKEEYER